MKPFLFDEPLLPDGFRFPQKYEELAKNGSWPDLEPWSFLAMSKPHSLAYYGQMLLKFPMAKLIPFAYINDISGLYNDGWIVLACFDADSTLKQPIVRIYDFGAPKNTPWDNLSYKGFEEWLIAAQKESIRFKAEKAEIESDE